MEKIIKHQSKLFFLLILLIIVNFLGSILLNKQNIFRKFDYKKWEDKYNKSQWVAPESKNEISDDDLYIFEGYKFVKGHDPSLLSAEVPPLGKYLIGYSEVITGNVGFYGIFFSGLSLILFFILNKLIFRSNLIAIIPVVPFSVELLFREQIGVSLLDVQYLSLLLLTFILFLKKKYLLSGIAVGLFMATKSPFLAILLYVCLFSCLAIKKNLKIKNLILMPIVSFATYTLIHLQLFILGHDFLYFLRVQKYMLHFYQTGVHAAPGTIFPLTLFGYWFTWFNKNGFIKEWNILWPVTFLISIFSVCKAFRAKDVNEGILLIIIWLMLYTAFLVTVPVFPRYLLLTLPFMYNLAVWGILKTIKPRLLQH